MPLLAFCAYAWGALPTAAAAAPPSSAHLDPVGTWSCVIYGNPALGDEEVLLRLGGDGRAALARTGTDPRRPWSALSPWNAVDAKLRFEDPRTGRRFEGDLQRSALGGSWRTLSLIGGWWCTRLEAGSTRDEREPPPVFEAPRLVAVSMAMPAYPRAAIRAAKEGRAVTCYLINSAGLITAPEIIELSDEVFRAPTLSALERSRYRGWDDASILRPGCRTYIYRLDPVRDPPP